MSSLDFRDSKGSPPPISINVSMDVSGLKCIRCKGDGKRHFWFLRWGKCDICKGSGDFALPGIEFESPMAEAIKAIDEWLKSTKEHP